jgi:hypothetical protein
MEPGEAHSDHRLGLQVEGNTTCKHPEEVGKEHLKMAVEDTRKVLVDGVLAQRSAPGVVGSGGLALMRLVAAGHATHQA